MNTETPAQSNEVRDYVHLAVKNEIQFRNSVRDVLALHDLLPTDATYRVGADVELDHNSVTIGCLDAANAEALVAALGEREVLNVTYAGVVDEVFILYKVKAAPDAKLSLRIADTPQNLRRLVFAETARTTYVDADETGAAVLREAQEGDVL